MQSNVMIGNEIIFSKTLSSGLKVLIHPKPDFLQTVATLQANFGGGDVEFVIENSKKEIPSGTAHFLEHVLFENNGRDLTEHFSRYGAEINAYTARSLTAYSFTTQNDFEYLLGYLLESFCNVDFSEDSINKERNIIERELKMSDDDIQYEANIKLKKLMYKDKRAIVQIGGTVKEIEKIDSKLLKDVFTTFYHPKNMALIITGPVEPEKIIDFLENHEYNNCDWPAFKPFTKQFHDEKRVRRSFTKFSKNHEVNYVEIAVKLNDEIFTKIKNPAKLNLLIGAFAGYYLSKSSSIYKKLKDMNLINYSYMFDTYVEPDFGYISISSETKKPKEFIKNLKKMLNDIPESKTDDFAFEANKKRAIGNFIKMFDSINSINDFVSTNFAKGIDVFNYLKDVNELTVSDMNEFKRMLINKEYYTVSYLKSHK